MSLAHDGTHATSKAANYNVKKLFANGIPAAKILLGVPFYGRHFQTRVPYSYHNIVKTYSQNLTSMDVEPICFNGPDTIGRNVALAGVHCIARIMIWELRQDAPGNQSLLKVIDNAAKVANIISK